MSAAVEEGRLTATRDAPVGGQAVLEGVMMRGVSTWAVAVRKPPAEDRDRPGRDPPHHHALEHGLTADGRVARGDQAPPARLPGRPPVSRRIAYRQTFAHRREGSGARGRARGAPALGDSTLEALDPSAGVDQLLPAGVEGVAGGADLDMDFGLGRASHELVAARAADVSFDVLRMDIGLHHCLV